MRTMSVTALALLIMNSTSLLALDVESCLPVLKPLEVTNITSDLARLTVASEITRQQFLDAKNSGSFGLDVVIEGIPLSGYGDWDSFNRARNRELQRYSFDLDLTTKRYLSLQYVDDQAFGAYIDCLRVASSELGLHAYVSQLQGELFTVTVRYRAMGNAPDLVLQSNAITITNGVANNIVFPITIPNNGNYVLTIERDLSKPFSFTVNGGGTSDSLSFPAVPTFPKFRRETLTLTSNGVTAVSKRHSVSMNDCVAPPESNIENTPWLFDIATSNGVVAAIASSNSTCAQCRFELSPSPTETRACAMVTVHPCKNTGRVYQCRGYVQAVVQRFVEESASPQLVVLDEQ